MIVRILQSLSSNKTKSHTFLTEVFNETTKKWTIQKNCVYHIKNAKVKFKDKLVYLVGYTVDNDDEKCNLEANHFIGNTIDWNDDTITYPYVEWVSYFEAYD
jgi:hypothetical protein